MSSAALLEEFPTPRSAPAAAALRSRVWTPAQALLDQLSEHPDAPGFSVAGLRIVQLTETAGHGVQELAGAVLADAFIAQKLLRAANLVVKTRGSAPVTTISRAIVVIGLEQVKALATSTIQTDQIKNPKQAGRVHDELARALYATTLARELSSGRPAFEPEEASVCALLRGFGRLVAALYLYGPYEDALTLSRQEHISESEAAVRTMGMGFDHLGVEVLNSWGLPERIVQAALPCPAHVRASSNPQVNLRIMAEFCVDIAEVASEPEMPGRGRLIETLLDRFGHPLGVVRKGLKQALRATDEHARDLGQAVGLFGIGAAGDCVDASTVVALSPSNRPGASLTLAAGVTSLRRMIERESAPEAMLKYAAEVLYLAYDFQRVLVCLKHPSSGVYGVHTVVGKALRSAEASFGFKEMGAHDVFNIAVLQNADVYIRDTGDPRLLKNLPDWLKTSCPNARSFLLLPIANETKSIGFFYADHHEPHVARFTQEEVQLLKTLKQQAWIAAHRAQSESHPAF